MSTERKPRYAVNEWSTPHNTVVQDIEQIARTGGQAIGLFGGKFREGEDAQYLEAMQQHGLVASYCVPEVWTILPTPFNVPGIPSDPRQRTELICEGMRRLTPFKPAAFIIGPGVSGDANRPLQASSELADGLAQVADLGAELGIPVAFELLAVRRGRPWARCPRSPASSTRSASRMSASCSTSGTAGPRPTSTSASSATAIASSACT